MGKKKKTENIIEEETSSVNAILAEDKNDIEEATEKAMQNVDSVAYSNNLVKPKKGKTKSIRNLEIKEQEPETTVNMEENLKPEEIPANPANTEEDKTYTMADPEKKSYKTPIIISSIVIGIIVLFLLFSTIFALANKTDKIVKGVYINKVDVSGLTREQALDKLNNAFKSKLSKPITLKRGNYQIEISPEQLGVTFNINEAVDIAYAKGHSGNIFQDNFEIITCGLSNIQINPGFSYNEEALNTLVKEMNANFEDALVQSGYYIDGNNLILSKGKDGVVIDTNALKTDISYTITNLDYNISGITIPTQYTNVNKLDLNKIHNEIKKEPKNAYYTKDPYAVYPHVDGIDFNISVQEATTILNNSTENSVSIPLKIISPEITTNDLGTEAFPNELGSYSTSYSTWNSNRTTNIELAAEKINGTVVMPGEEFSYNITVGERTASAGFKTAAVYVGGEVTDGIGGGICQVSSTLYNAVLLSNLEITERYNHCFYPGYIPVGRDATVSWGSVDFCFKNNRNYPIKILCDGTGGTVDVQILGLYEKTEYEVEIESYVTRWITYSTVTKEDPTLKKGETQIIEEGSNGLQSVAYRILKLNGEEVSRELLSQDSYSPHNKIVAVGTGV